LRIHAAERRSVALPSCFRDRRGAAQTP
jgi:hypothetical protein